MRVPNPRATRCSSPAYAHDFVAAWWELADSDVARVAVEKMLTYGNHFGLYSEEIGPSGELLGRSCIRELAAVTGAALDFADGVLAGGQFVTWSPW